MDLVANARLRRLDCYENYYLFTASILVVYVSLVIFI